MGESQRSDAVARIKEHPTLGAALRSARLASGYKTQESAAKASGYREKDISRWESGAAEPRASVVVTLSKLYAPNLDLTKVANR
jgi:hypothetical protein